MSKGRNIGKPESHYLLTTHHIVLTTYNYAFKQKNKQHKYTSNTTCFLLIAFVFFV
ncbi:hypothetical protein HmCmsJML031_04160 [Escherichia coli]|nr:hypothetical protein HmCmsJML031_04160 [Escherichia coli]